MEKEGSIRFCNVQLQKAFQVLESTDKELYKEIDKALTEIQHNVFCGRNVKKELIPKDFRKEGFDNLWIYNLRDNWRLLYSIATPDKIEVLAIVLQWMNHKDYERLFKF